MVFIAFGLIVFNITQLNFNDLFSKESVTALIGIVASFCAVCILLIFKMSKSIESKTKE